MCDLDHGQEVTLDVPSHLLNNKQAFSIDYGGSVVKFAYTTGDGDKTKLHLTTYPATSPKEAFTEFAKKITHIPKGGDVFTCGLGCNEHAELIKDILGFEPHNVMETDVFIDAFRFMTNNFPLSELAHPVSEVAKKYAESMAQKWATAQHSFSVEYHGTCRVWESTKRILAAREGKVAEGSSSTPPKEDRRSAKIKYPNIVMICGSAGAPLLVHDDESYECLEVISASGKTLLAMGSLLTGAKTFEELVALAERGDLDKLDVTGRSLKLESEDVYASLSSEFTAFAFGQAVGKDLSDFSKEDLALGVIALMCRHLAISTFNWSLTTNVDQVFFTGGLHASSSLVRELMEKDFMYRSQMNYLGKEKQHYFMKHGTYLGAIGGLLRTVKKSS